MNEIKINNFVELYKKLNPKYYKSIIKSSLLRIYNIYEKYVFEGGKIFDNLSNEDIFYKLDLIFNKVVVNKSMKEQFVILLDNEDLGNSAYILYCKNKTKKMKEKVSSDKRFYSMDLESFIFREGIEEGTISYNKFVETQKKSSKRCIEYWISNGYSKQEAIECVKNHQTTFSKKICIQKHGEVNGLQIFEERQQKWQNTLNNKSVNEIDIINYKKNPYRKEILKEKYNDKWKEIIYEAYNISSEYQKFNLYEYLYHYIKPEKFLHCSIDRMLNIVPKYIWTLFEIFSYSEKVNAISIMLSKYNLKFHNNVKFISHPKFSRYHLYIQDLDIILRSSNEIYFYNLLQKYNIKFNSNLRYPNSTKFYDFFLIDYNVYIELTSFNEKSLPSYFTNMKEKMINFNIKFITDRNFYEPFLQDLIYANATSSSSTSISVSG